MKKNEALKIVNPVMAVLLLNQAVTASLHDLIPMELYEDIHVTGGVLLIIGAAIHLALNWNWVQTTYLKK